MLILEEALTGACYWSQFDVSENFTEDFRITDIIWAREATIGGVCFLAGLSFSSILTVIHGKRPRVGMILSLVLIGLSSVSIVVMSAVFNMIWSLTWMFSFLTCALIEMLVG